MDAFHGQYVIIRFGHASLPYLDKQLEIGKRTEPSAASQSLN
jgi:hypothetical protein